jgi:GT2 family glycosyltransferase
VTEIAPLASVIVVCWNSEDVIERCLEHLFAQDYANFEIVVVDDGSSDDTLELAEESLGSGKVTIVHSPLNRGCPHARNLGLRHARGEFIAFIDADGFATPSWLSAIVDTFEADETIGGVASTVFLASNPLVLNGAGGIVNRQGWGADLLMNESYERAEIAEEVLYPMGCGMSLRRSAVERVGPFDDRMLNYYDDVDYGMRLWRAGYRVVVSPDAWIDHGFGHSSGGSTLKLLLCEQHRMRVVLKHTPLRRLGRWVFHEVIATRRSFSPRYELKLSAVKWNIRYLPSTLLSRWRLRAAPHVPDRLIDSSWGENFPEGVLPIRKPRPEKATRSLDMADSRASRRLLYGWYPAEHVDGRSFRWASTQAAAIVHLDTPARRVRLRFSHVPDDIGWIDVTVREVGAIDPLEPAWSARIEWQYIEQTVENHPIALPAGDYEVVFSARRTWTSGKDKRLLAFALSSMSFDESDEIPTGGLQMSGPQVGAQLVSGWFEPEEIGERSYRWGSGRAAATVRLLESASAVRIGYRMAPVSVGLLRISAYALGSAQPVWSAEMPWHDGEWHDEELPLSLPAGDYLFELETESTWSNPDQRDAAFPPDNRALGFALSELSFRGSTATGGERT